MGNTIVDQYIKRYTGNTDAIYVTNAQTTVTSTWSGGKEFGKIMFLRDCNLASVTSTYILKSTAISSATTLKAGSVFIGRFSKVKFKRGGAVVYTWD